VISTHRPEQNSDYRKGALPGAGACGFLSTGRNQDTRLEVVAAEQQRGDLDQWISSGYRENNRNAYFLSIGPSVASRANLYSTFAGVGLHELSGAEISNKGDIKEWVESLWVPGQGYNDTTVDLGSTLVETYWATRVLRGLGYRPVNPEGVLEYVTEFLRTQNVTASAEGYHEFFLAGMILQHMREGGGRFDNHIRHLIDDMDVLCDSNGPATEKKIIRLSIALSALGASTENPVEYNRSCVEKTIARQLVTGEASGTINSIRELLAIDPSLLGPQQRPQYHATLERSLGSTDDTLSTIEASFLAGEVDLVDVYYAAEALVAIDETSDVTRLTALLDRFRVSEGWAPLVSSSPLIKENYAAIRIMGIDSNRSRGFDLDKIGQYLRESATYAIDEGEWEEAAYALLALHELQLLDDLAERGRLEEVATNAFLKNNVSIEAKADILDVCFLLQCSRDKLVSGMLSAERLERSQLDDARAINAIVRADMNYERWQLDYEDVADVIEDLFRGDGYSRFRESSAAVDGTFYIADILGYPDMGTVRIPAVKSMRNKILGSRRGPGFVPAVNYSGDPTFFDTFMSMCLLGEIE
jgi:hypothetical protein